MTNAGLLIADSAGTSTVAAAMTNTGTIDIQTGTFALTGTVAGSGVIDIGAGATLRLPATSGQTVTFEGAGDLVLGAPSSFAEAAPALQPALLATTTGADSIAGLQGGDTIELVGEDLKSAVLNGSTLAVTLDSGSVLDFAVSGPVQPSQISVSGDEIMVVCFLAGTAIATPAGDCPIETLKAGDLVLTAHGAAVPVRWLGQQTVATRFAAPSRVAPIRIRDGALGEDLPVRDLLVSPDHALMVDGVFVQAGALVNGVSITREDRNMPETLVYFHVELADHSLILAEGVAAETFIDNVDRLAFDNWDEHVALGDDTAPMREMPLARAKAHRQVPRALRATLLARGVEIYGRDVAAVA